MLIIFQVYFQDELNSIKMKNRKFLHDKQQHPAPNFMYHQDPNMGAPLNPYFPYAMPHVMYPPAYGMVQPPPMMPMMYPQPQPSMATYPHESADLKVIVFLLNVYPKCCIFI